MPSIATNRPFDERGYGFPNAICVVFLIDRLVHRAGIIPIQGDSGVYNQVLPVP